MGAYSALWLLMPQHIVTCIFCFNPRELVSPHGVVDLCLHCFRHWHVAWNSVPMGHTTHAMISSTTSQCRFDVIMTLLLRNLFPGLCYCRWNIECSASSNSRYKPICLFCPFGNLHRSRQICSVKNVIGFLRKRWRATAWCGKSKFTISSGWLTNGSLCHPDDIITLS